MTAKQSPDGVTAEMIEAGATALDNKPNDLYDNTALAFIVLEAAMHQAKPEHSVMVEVAWKAFTLAKQAGSDDFDALGAALASLDPLL